MVFIPIPLINKIGLGIKPKPILFGEGGIRTRGEVSPTTTFEVVTLNHSDTSPFGLYSYNMLSKNSFKSFIFSVPIA